MVCETAFRHIWLTVGSETQPIPRLTTTAQADVLDGPIPTRQGADARSACPRKASFHLAQPFGTNSSRTWRQAEARFPLSEEFGRGAAA
jgi:hypothetical protein